MTKTGNYIVIEGHDGTGKSTQVHRLTKWLTQMGHEVVVVEEPGSDDPEKSTPIATELRRVIKDATLVRSPEVNVALFSAARHELWHQKIAPALQRGAFVLSARNYFSTLAYQGLGEGVDRHEIERMTRLFTDDRYMAPDLGIILTLENDTERTQRIAKRGELDTPDTFESRDTPFQDRVHNAYYDIAKEYDVAIIDASQSIEAVTTEIQTRIQRLITQ